MIIYLSIRKTSLKKGVIVNDLSGGGRGENVNVVMDTAQKN